MRAWDRCFHRMAWEDGLGQVLPQEDAESLEGLGQVLPQDGLGGWRMAEVPPGASVGH